VGLSESLILAGLFTLSSSHMQDIYSN